MTIQAVEEFLVNTLKTRFGARVKGVESLPSDWDDDTIKRMLRLAPGVFVVFAGGPAQQGGTEILGRWVIVAVTSHKSGELARRHGDAREIGAYEIVETVVPLLHGLVVPDVGSLTFADMQNMFSAANEARGLAVYGAAFDLPMTLAPPEDGSDPLDDFITFHADTDLAPADGVREAGDTVSLPQ